MKKATFRREKRVTTPDGWFQPGPGGTVVVTLSHRRQKGAPWHVSVWGDDDCGMVLETQEQDAAFRAFGVVRDGLTKKSLETLGFRDDS